MVLPGNILEAGRSRVFDLETVTVWCVSRTVGSDILAVRNQKVCKMAHHFAHDCHLSRLDTDPRLLEKQEQQQPTYVALSYVNR